MNLAENLQQIQNKIATACQNSNRNPNEIKLLAVSKTKPIELILELHKLGQKSFGENYLQEAIEKIKSSQNSQIEWHFIGHLQSKKAKEIPGNFHLFHCLDRLSLAEKLDGAAKEKNSILNCLVQVNIDEEESKSGILINKLEFFLTKLNSLESLKVIGLMCIPKATENKEHTRQSFRKMYESLKKINESSIYKHTLSELSMGMSNDYEIAIEEGATIIRIGSALLGHREKRING